MRRVDRYETSDGVLHDTERAARSHCENRMGDILTRHAHSISHMTRYSQVVEFLEASLESLAEARRWQIEAEGPISEEE